MSAIADFQKEYFLTGDETKLKPMILKDIADQIQMDISTVSRVANSKYVATPYGTKLIKEFFSESMKNDQGEDVFAMIGPHYISYVRLSDAKLFRSPISGYLKPVDHGHISCRNILRPGWCYFSSYSNIVGAVRIAKSKSLVGLGVPSVKATRSAAVFELWGSHESSSSDYASQPKLSVSPSGAQVIFTSDWHGNEDINDYVISVQKN